jgi:CHAT domain-containing protein
MLTTARVEVRAGLETPLAERARSLQELLSAKSEQRVRLLSGKHTEAQLAGLSSEIGELLSKYKDLEDQLRASNPNYSELTQPQTLRSQDVQRDLLDSNTVLLEYSLGEERSYVFAVTQATVTSYELPRRSEIEAEARLVYSLLTARNRYIKRETITQRDLRLSGLEEQFDRAAAKLAKLVLEPVTGQIKSKGARLLIVSDGALQYIPFAALPMPRAPGDLQAPPPLVADHEIVNLPSASVLGVLRQAASGRKPPPKAVAVLADPVFSKDDIRVQKSARHAGHTGIDDDSQVSALSREHLTRSVADISGGNGESLPRLRFTRREAEAVTVITAGEVSKVLDFKANRAAATSPELAQYRIVHFATHGLLDSEHPELSGLVLSLVDKQGRPENGFLELQDIYNLNLPVDLVVLSACETGLGKEINGEGMIGLTRGFMYAGATRVVASLWKVSDVATAELMERFYRAMEVDRLPAAAALRAAQIQMWKQKHRRSPYFWAAFQIQGEWR